jgi:hypothetical protein
MIVKDIRRKEFGYSNSKSDFDQRSKSAESLYQKGNNIRSKQKNEDVLELFRRRRRRTTQSYSTTYDW